MRIRPCLSYKALGAAAGVARLPIDLLNDPHLRSRSFFQNVERAFIGLHPQPSMPIRESSDPYPTRAAAPTLGQHNTEVLSELLGLSDAQIAELVADWHYGACRIRSRSTRDGFSELKLFLVASARSLINLNDAKPDDVRVFLYGKDCSASSGPGQRSRDLCSIHFATAP
ncbi:CoA transferase [Bradyrhizobium japonicum]|uniref:CoA transferase n=1 Tax=Bradyrhizobium japonicum TaxID=375 RepID=UPI0024C03DD4|nr:CoA transferase [Bradyrhizobium japonicum]